MKNEIHYEKSDFCFSFYTVAVNEFIIFITLSNTYMYSHMLKYKE